MAVTRRNVLAGTATAALALGLGGVAAALAPRPAEASIVMGAREMALPGMPIDLGAYQARVPAGFIAQDTETNIPVADDDAELAAALPRTWQLVCTDESMQTVVTLVATPYLAGELDDADIERLNGTEDIVSEAALLLDCLNPDGALTGIDPIYLGVLPYQNNEMAFNLLFFSGLQPRQVTAAAFLPATGEATGETTDETTGPTVLTAIFSSQKLELLLPAIDELFGSLEPARPETERLIETLDNYQKSRG